MKRRSLVVLVMVVACSCGSTAASPASTSAPPPVTGSPAPAPIDAAPTAPVTVPTSATTAATAAAPSATSPRAWAEPCGHGPSPGAYDHVIWIWMENKNLSSVLDSTHAPFMTKLGDNCGLALRYVDHGLRPSLPNYIAATSGGSHGIHDDDGPSAHQLTVDNVFRQVRSAGKAAKSYEESMPSACALAPSGRYAVKHNPAAYYTGGDDRQACRRDDVPFTDFLPDLASGLPAFAFVTPDMCNDMHDCPVSTGDAWLAKVVPAITSSATYRQGRTALFIVFDESAGGGTMPFIAVAPSITPGTRSSVELDHDALLAFTEAALGITDRLGKAAGAADLAGAFGL